MAEMKKSEFTDPPPMSGFQLLEDRVAKLEKRIERLEPCPHEFEPHPKVVGLSRCRKCGVVGNVY